MPVRFFILDSTFGGRHKVVNDPLGWDSSTRQLKRNKIFNGVFPFMLQELEFYGAEDIGYIENVFLQGGTEAQMFITEYIKIDGKDEFKIRFEGVGIFGIEYTKEYKDGLTPYVKFKFSKTGFQDKLFNNMKNKIDLSSTTSLGGVDLGELDTRQIANEGRVIVEKNTFTHPENVEPIQIIIQAPGEQGFAVPFISDIKESASIQTVENTQLNEDGSFFYNFGQSADIFFQAEFCIDMAVIGGVFNPIDYVRLELRTYTDIGNLNIYNTELIQDLTVNPLPSLTGGFSHNIFFIIHRYVDESEALAIVIVAQAPQPVLDVFINCTIGGANPDFTTPTEGLNNLVNLDVDVTASFDSTVTECVYRFEAFERIVESITDTTGSLKSQIFDRPDRVGSITDFDNIPEAGIYAHEVLQTGLQIRGIEVSDGEDGVKTVAPQMSLQDMFKSMRAKYNVGLRIEDINRKTSVVVEDMADFYRGNVVVTAHNVTDIRTTGTKDYTYSDVVVGYKKAELEIVNGLGDFNNKSTYKTTISSTSSTLDLTSMERADTYGIEDLRRNNVQFGSTTDHKDDKEVFGIVVEDTGIIIPDAIIPTPDKSIVYEGIEDPDNAYNGFITPDRNLRRNGDWLSGGLLVYQDPQYIVKHTSEDLAVNMQTTDGLDEQGQPRIFNTQSDIQNSDLLNPLWNNRVFSGKCVIEREEFDKLEAEPYGIFKFSPNTRNNTKHYDYVWILNFTYDDHTKELDFEGLQVNLDSPRLNLVDPEGVDQNPEETEEEEVITGGFESEFESILEG